MTSSYRATGAASVRQMPAHEAQHAVRWSLNELAISTPADSLEAIQLPVVKEISPEERAALIDEGYARGLADGERRALAATQAATQARLNEIMAVVAQATTQLHEAASAAPAVLEENVAALAIVVAQQIIGREVALDASLVADLVRRSLTEFPIDQSVRIRVNPQDLTAITFGTGAGDGAPITGSRDASWLADPRVARGGCLIEGRDRIIDGRVDTGLERAYRRMAGLDAA